MNYKVKPNKEGQLPKQAVADMRAEFKANAEKWLEVMIKPFKKKYSYPQLQYWYAGIRTPFALHFGYDLDTAHELLKDMCGWVDIISDPDGNEKRIIRSITKNEKGERSSTTDIMFLIETATRICAEHGLQVQTPDEYYENNPIEYK